MPAPAFLASPGRSGAFGALLDEYARAAGEFCAGIAAFDPARWGEAKAGNEEITATPRRTALHVCRAAWGYSKQLRTALELPLVSKPAKLDEAEASPAEVTAELVRALRDTEQAAEPLHALSEAQTMAMTWTTPWGQLYDPEVLFEHAIVHLLRHRRQIERW